MFDVGEVVSTIWTYPSTAGNARKQGPLLWPAKLLERLNSKKEKYVAVSCGSLEQSEVTYDNMEKFSKPVAWGMKELQMSQFWRRAECVAYELAAAGEGFESSGSDKEFYLKSSNELIGTLSGFDKQEFAESLRKDDLIFARWPTNEYPIWPCRVELTQHPSGAIKVKAIGSGESFFPFLKRDCVPFSQENCDMILNQYKDNRSYWSTLVKYIVMSQLKMDIPVIGSILSPTPPIPVEKAEPSVLEPSASGSNELNRSKRKATGFKTQVEASAKKSRERKVETRRKSQKRSKLEDDEDNNECNNDELIFEETFLRNNFSKSDSSVLDLQVADLFVKELVNRKFINFDKYSYISTDKVGSLIEKKDDFTCSSVKCVMFIIRDPATQNCVACYRKSTEARSVFVADPVQRAARGIKTPSDSMTGVMMRTIGNMFKGTEVNNIKLHPCQQLEDTQKSLELCIALLWGWMGDLEPEFRSFDEGLLRLTLHGIMMNKKVADFELTYKPPEEFCPNVNESGMELELKC